MPSTFDSLLRLELQATGENENTWGEKANQNFELIGEAIAGHVSVDIAGSGNKTLTTGNATTDEARRAFITLSGLLTGAVSVIAPSASKLYIVRNNATQASNPILLKTASGVAVTVEPSSLALYACDGTDFWRVEDTTKVGLSGGTISGNLGVTGNVSVGGVVSVSTLAVTGNAVFTSVSAATLDVSGAAEIAGNVSVGGTFVATGNSSFGGEVSIASNLTVEGEISVSGTGSFGRGVIFGGETPPYDRPIFIGVSTLSGVTYFPLATDGFSFVGGVVYGTNVYRLRSLSDGGGPLLEYFDGTALYGCRAFASDGKLKIEIRPNTDDNLAIVNALAPRTFKWKANSLEAPIGLIAQEAEAVAPGAVWETEDGTKHMDVLSLTARLIGAVQQLSQRIEELEARVDDLEI